MVIAIITYSKPAFFCKRCSLSSQVLYMDGDERYCESCASNDIKSKAKYYNQNQEEVDYRAINE